MDKQKAHTAAMISPCWPTLTHTMLYSTAVAHWTTSTWKKSLKFSNPWIQNDVHVHCLQARVHCRQATAVLPHNVPLHKHHPPHPPGMRSTHMLSVSSTDDSDRLGGVDVLRPHDVDDALQGSLSELVHDLHQQHALLLLRHQLVTLPVCVTSQLLRCYKDSTHSNTLPSSNSKRQILCCFNLKIQTVVISTTCPTKHLLWSISSHTWASWTFSNVMVASYTWGLCLFVCFFLPRFL
jgi:hypothetical protein